LLVGHAIRAGWGEDAPPTTLTVPSADLPCQAPTRLTEPCLTLPRRENKETR
jgi:hypothetical protein